MSKDVGEWTVIAEKAPGAATGEQLGPFLRALLANAASIAPVASFDPDTDALTAQFEVVADSREDAALRGCFAYWGALAAAGAPLTAVSTLLVAPHEDAGDARRFTARALIQAE
jgi:hypothetical protein